MAPNYPELRPCPFCGAEPCYAADGGPGLTVWCVGCDFPWLQQGPIEDVAAEWNKRIEPGEAHAKIYNRVYDALQGEPASLRPVYDRVFAIWREVIAKSAGMGLEGPE
jgi:hypothetical protein